MTIKPGDIVMIQDGKFVIASGRHGQPVSEPQCDNCRYEDLPEDAEPCNACNWDGGRLTRYEPKQTELTDDDFEEETVCDVIPAEERHCRNCLYRNKIYTQEPCCSCNRHNSQSKSDHWIRFGGKYKPSREATEQTIMEHMVAIRAAYKAYTDEPAQDLSLSFYKDGKISFFNYFGSKNEREPIYRVEGDND